jgi:hypothetical protein
MEYVRAHKEQISTWPGPVRERLQEKFEEFYKTGRIEDKDSLSKVLGPNTKDRG